MKKVFLTAIIFLATTAILYAVTVVGPRIMTGGTPYEPIRTIEQNTTGLTDTLATVFPNYKLDSGNMTLYLQNYGVAALQDLQILLSPTISSTAEFDVQGKSALSGTTPSLFLHQVGCVDSLASGAICIMTIASGIPFGNLEIKAMAAAGTTTEVRIWVLDQRRK